MGKSVAGCGGPELMRAATLLAFLLGVIAGAIGVYALVHPGPPRVHKLQFPMLLSGGTADSPPTILPKGTSLYYDWAAPEGFVRYKLYVNVEGANLESRPATEKFWIDPLTAFPFDKDNLRKLLTDYPVSRDDLSAILRSGQLSRQEIRDLLNEYSQ